MSIRAFGHVQLAAPPGCEEAARQFFGEVLGLAIDDRRRFFTTDPRGNRLSVIAAPER